VYVLLAVIRCSNNLYTYSETIEKFRIRKKERKKEKVTPGVTVGMHEKEIHTLSAAERC
jgi:hypothetical protein